MERFCYLTPISLIRYTVFDCSNPIFIKGQSSSLPWSQPLLQLFFQSRGHEDRAAGRCGLGAFQDERSGAALQLVRENLDDTAIVHLIQGFLPHPLHGFVDAECSDAIGGIEVNIIGGQTYDLALSQRTDQSEVDCQMQNGVFHAVQSGPHFIYRPDGALLCGLLGAVHRNRTFDNDAPLHSILESGSQQSVDFVDGRAGEGTPLLLLAQFLFFALDIRATGRFAQGRIR